MSTFFKNYVCVFGWWWITCTFCDTHMKVRTTGGNRFSCHGVGFRLRFGSTSVLAEPGGGEGGEGSLLKDGSCGIIWSLVVIFHCVAQILEGETQHLWPEKLEQSPSPVTRSRKEDCSASGRGFCWPLSSCSLSAPGGVHHSTQSAARPKKCLLLRLTLHLVAYLHMLAWTSLLPSFIGPPWGHFWLLPAPPARSFLLVFTGCATKNSAVLLPGSSRL